jgi:hypothetical protein
VLTVPDDFAGPDRRGVFRCFVLPTNLTEDKYVTAIELRPGNPRVVHHVLLFTDTSEQGRKRKKGQDSSSPRSRSSGQHTYDRGPGYSVGMGGVGFTPRGL